MKIKSLLIFSDILELVIYKSPLMPSISLESHHYSLSICLKHTLTQTDVKFSNILNLIVYFMIWDP